jgi:hypothetical protein
MGGEEEGRIYTRCEMKNVDDRRVILMGCQENLV